MMTRSLASSVAVPIEALEVSAFLVPTERPESDGSFAWDATTLVTVEVRAGDQCGLGYTYANRATAMLIDEMLRPVVEGYDALASPSAWDAMTRAVRNVGRPGVAAMAISAVDVALWDLKARLLDLPLVSLLGVARESVPVYGSGGFTSYSLHELQEQLGAWWSAGFERMKMKVGREPDADVRRVQAARQAIGPSAELFVDANGAYDRKQALHFARAFADAGVSWFEEPVSSDDLEGLRLMRDRGPAGMDVAAGEYGYDRFYFRRMLEAGAVDVLQPDATRCGGITGFLAAAALASAHHVPISAHTAPALHLHVGCALTGVRHLEWFYDHARIERLLFDGAVEPVGGHVRPDTSRPGLGLELKHADAARFAIV